ncbi:hypothetical protein LTR53_016750 [Teratosphaeriaceae sp. CCFEE 6253]|nr:hypothetical protein LTR53_016750 [Teratosphaeriaceae sp. CCFEE 6253]
MKQPPEGMLDGLHKDGPDVGVQAAASKQSPSRHHADDQEHARDPAGIVDRLPGDDGVWKNSALGHPDTWTKALHSTAHTLSSFPYPAAAFWGEELVLLHNAAWADAGGRSEQGQRQRGALSADVYRALSSALHGGQPRRLASHELLRQDAPDQHEQYTVLISPLFAERGPSAEVAGLLVQLLPTSELDSEERGRDSEASGAGHVDLDQVVKNGQVDMSKLGSAIDNVPLDEHPFFHRFAEMLPSGLAILDHKAQCVFVNQHFYQLTTHKGDEQSFKSWPRSIHPDDYDRVMNAYQEAFESRQQLRTEFRNTGDQQPWRLLLLTPLGDENLQHVSLREYGGFICSLVDISAEKGAEIAERKAAKEARERREQQERFIDMISHEIRNPLSAILHCSEDIDQAVSDERQVDVAAVREALETINLFDSTRAFALKRH